MLLQLDYLQFEPALRLTIREGARFVFDPIRRKQVALTPEELLRQLVLLYLMKVKSYPATRIRSEIGLSLNKRPKRCDIAVFDAELQPWLIIECKSPKVALTTDAFEQAARYNLQFQAPYLAVTNGLATYCCALDFAKQQFTFLTDFPDYKIA